MKRALGALFNGAVGRDMISRVWRKLKPDCEAWTRRDLAGEDVVRLILDGTVVLDRKATNISLLVSARRPPRRAEGAAGGAQHGRRERTPDLIAGSLRTPEFLIVDVAARKALAAL